MSSTIKSLSGTAPTSVARSRTSQQSAPDSATTAKDGAEQVHITRAASRLASLGQGLSALPAIDAARVERISQALAMGTYSISADNIASGLLQSDNALAQIGL